MDCDNRHIYRINSKIHEEYYFSQDHTASVKCYNYFFLLGDFGYLTSDHFNLFPFLLPSAQRLLRCTITTVLTSWLLPAPKWISISPSLPLKSLKTSPNYTKAPSCSFWLRCQDFYGVHSPLLQQVNLNLFDYLCFPDDFYWTGLLLYFSCSS